MLTFKSAIFDFVAALFGSKSIVNPPPLYEVILPQCDRPSSSFSVLYSHLC